MTNARHQPLGLKSLLLLFAAGGLAVSGLATPAWAQGRDGRDGFSQRDTVRPSREAPPPRRAAPPRREQRSTPPPQQRAVTPAPRERRAAPPPQRRSAQDGRDRRSAPAPSISRPRPAETAPPPQMRRVGDGDGRRGYDRDINPRGFDNGGRDRRVRDTPVRRDLVGGGGDHRGDRDGGRRYGGDYRDRRDHNDRRGRDYRDGNDRDIGRYERDHRDHRRYGDGSRRGYDHYYRQRHDFWRDRGRHRSHIQYYAHLNRGWHTPRYYGYWGAPSAWRYHSRYYSRGYDRRQFAYYGGLCRYNSGQATLVGAMLGAIIGGSVTNDDDALAGALVGAGLGAVFADSFNRFDKCDHGQFQYAINYAFEYGEPYYWSNPYTGVRGAVIIRDTYYRGGYDCRWADAEIYLPNGGYQYDQVRMCRDAYGQWRVAPRQ